MKIAQEIIKELEFFIALQQEDKYKPKVKKLEWEEDETYNGYATDIYGFENYLIEKIGNVFILYILGEAKGSQYSSLLAAQEAAQSHFESLILGCLEL